ncbi:hypothetical protein [Pantoea agglomerans]|uniref:hypothetical protein n=1 Tax=Enterobacter agglomerans TaxID=549 RepID=UPI00320B981E
MSALPTHNYLHLYRLATMEGELLASAALNRISGQNPNVVCAITAMAGFRFAGWRYDCRTDLSSACQAAAECIQNLALRTNPAGWKWAIEIEQTRRSQTPAA